MSDHMNSDYDYEDAEYKVPPLLSEEESAFIQNNATCRVTITLQTEYERASRNAFFYLQGEDLIALLNDYAAYFMDEKQKQSLLTCMNNLRTKHENHKRKVMQEIAADKPLDQKASTALKDNLLGTIHNIVDEAIAARTIEKKAIKKRKLGE